LAKDPDERYQTIKEVAIELKGLRRELAGTGIDTTVTPAARTTTTASVEAACDQNLSATTSQSSLSTRTSSAEYVVSGIKQHNAVLAWLRIDATELLIPEEHGELVPEPAVPVLG